MLSTEAACVGLPPCPPTTVTPMSDLAAADDGTTWASLSRRDRQAHVRSGASLLAVPDDLDRVVRRQAGVLTRQQLRSLGITPSQLRAALAARRWQAFGRNVVIVHNAALTRVQQEWVAVLLPAKTAALAGLSSSAAHGLRGFEPSQVHVVVSHATESRVPAWVRVHESRRFDPAVVRHVLDRPCTPLPRSVIDAATWSRHPRRACAIVCAAVQQRLVTAESLQAELGSAGRIRHVAIMRSILGDVAGGGHTLTEIELGPLAQQAGFDRPRRQRPRRDPSGRVRYLDIEFDLPDGTVLVVEIDGAAHMQHEQWVGDADRQNEIVIAKNPILRFPSVVVRLEPWRVVDQLRRIRLAYR